MSNTVSFSQEDFKNFKTEYNSAIENEKQMFVFGGNEFLTSYAKYVIEYLKTKFE
jgi:dihydrofolate reductase